MLAPITRGWPPFRRFDQASSGSSQARKPHRIAALCAEADPLDCHRCLLVGRALTEAGADVGHILSSGEIISHEQAEDRLVELAGLTTEGLLPASREQRLDEAYRRRARKVAYAMRKSSVNARGVTARRD